MDISSLLEVEVKEGKPSELHTNGEIADYRNIPDVSIRVQSAVEDVVTCNQKLNATISHDEWHYYKLMFGSDIASVRFRKLHCTACDVHIGSAPSQAHNMHEHPILHVLLCTSCRNFYGDGTFEQGDDATDMFCRWCANGGNLYCCSYCSNTFCYACIKRNFDPLVRKKIERDEKWKCFVCNPADLYSARASCWALLQHVQTVTRILQSDRKMTPEEVEAKMNLDESQCCPQKAKRKRSDTQTDEEECDDAFAVPKRKRRKFLNARRSRKPDIRKLKVESVEAEGATEDPDNSLQSNSNNVDREDIPLAELINSITSDPEDIPLARRQVRRSLRSRRSSRSTDGASKFSMDDELPAPLLQCDQSMIEGAESLSFGTVTPAARTVKSSTSRMAITPVPTANLLKKQFTEIRPAMRGGRERRLVRTLNPAPLFVRKSFIASNLTQPGNNACPSMPMVTIPSQNHLSQSPNRINVLQQPLQTTGLVRNTAGGMLRQIRPRIVLAKPIPNPNTTFSKTVRSQPPNVIDLESDEEVTVAPSEAPPERNTQESIETPARGPTKSINDVLDTLTSKFKKVLKSAMIFAPDKELVAAKAKTKAVNRVIKRTVVELTALSDNLISAYESYKRECCKDGVTHTPLITLKKKEKSNKIISLDMRCTRESEPESDAAPSDEDPDNPQDLQRVREIQPFARRANRGVDAKPQTENKSVQVDDTAARDYEKRIGYALLFKADYDPKRERDILRPVMVPDENFGKYEEEFISYLQYIEDRRNCTDVTDDDDSETCTSVNDLIEAEITAASQANEKANVVTSKEATAKKVKEKNSEENEGDEPDVISNPTKRSSNPASDCSSEANSSSKKTPKETPQEENLGNCVGEREVLEVEQSEMESTKKNNGTTTVINNQKGESQGADEKTVLAVRALIEDSSNENSNSALSSWKPVESDDECTVLD